jgi:leader peptidase (prepilin peptidase)/N-methyltransferase
MDIIHTFNTNLPFFYLTVALFSLIIGSFLNAAVYRIPIMLEKNWREGCEEYFGKSDTDDATDAKNEKTEPFNLFVPRSQCPQCGHMITSLENIPVLSYLFLRGKCSSCKTGISLQYPLTELATMLISLLIAWKFGVSVQTVALLLLTWTLITLSLIDLEKMLLPDNLTLPLLWLGIIFNYFGTVTDLRSSVIGAIVGYLSLWSVYWVFKFITNKDGFGFGDFKLLAALGAWGGWQVLPFTIFVSSLLGAVFGILLMIIQRSTESKQIPFGPWIALAGFIAILWREDIIMLMEHYFLTT